MSWHDLEQLIAEPLVGCTGGGVHRRVVGEF
jgi:hypothetical protein